MSPREDLASLQQAEKSIAALQLDSPNSAGASSQVLSSAVEGIRLARSDLRWNVWPTDTGKVFERVVSFTEKFAKFLVEVFGDEPGSQFRNVGPIAKANETLHIVARHAKLTKLYDEGQTARVARQMSESDPELEVLENRGKAVIDAVVALLDEAETALIRLSQSG